MEGCHIQPGKKALRHEIEQHQAHLAEAVRYNDALVQRNKEGGVWRLSLYIYIPSSQQRQERARKSSGLGVERSAEHWVYHSSHLCDLWSPSSYLSSVSSNREHIHTLSSTTTLPHHDWLTAVLCEKYSA